MATNQAEHSEPKTTTPEKDFLFTSKRSSNIPNSPKKKKEIFSFHGKSALHDRPQASSSEKPHHGGRTQKIKGEKKRPSYTKKKRKREYGDLKLKASGTCLHAPPLAKGGREGVRERREMRFKTHRYNRCEKSCYLEFIS
jgi:hypothetical protein